MLLAEDKSTNTQAGIIRQFDEFFINSGKLDLGVSFSSMVYQIKNQAPTKAFAFQYIKNAEDFLRAIKAYHDKDVEDYRLQKKAV